MRFGSTLTLILALASGVAFSSVASAATPEEGPGPMVDEPMEPGVMVREDRVRFRWGSSAQFGGLIMPVVTGTTSTNGSTTVVKETFVLGSIGANGQAGVQINDLIGIYFKPSFDILFGEIVGVQFGAALMVDFTLFDGMLSFGAGPDISTFIGFGGSTDSLSAAAGSLYGARLHVGWHPGVGFDDAPGPGRRAFTIGIDMRLLGGSVAVASVGTSETSASAGVDFFFAPILTLGFTDF